MQHLNMDRNQICFPNMTPQYHGPFRWDVGRFNLLIGLYYLHPDYNEPSKQREIYIEIANLLTDLLGNAVCPVEKVEHNLLGIKTNYAVDKILMYRSHLIQKKTGRPDYIKDSSNYLTVKIIDGFKKRNSTWNYKYWTHPASRNNPECNERIAKAKQSRPFSVPKKASESNATTFCKFIADVLEFIKEIKGDKYTNQVKIKIMRVLYEAHRAPNKPYNTKLKPPPDWSSQTQFVPSPPVFPKSCTDLFASNLRSVEEYAQVCKQALN